MTNSVLQYHYAHANDGAGLTLCQQGANPWGDNVVRCNVSVSDARKEKMGSLTWSSQGGAPMKGSLVYGNTVASADASTSIANRARAARPTTRRPSTEARPRRPRRRSARLPRV